MEFTIRIGCTNAAFEEDNRGYEVANILRRLADQIEDGRTLVYLNDSNGNSVGVAEFKA